MNKIELFTSFTLLSELEDVLQREKFLTHLKKIRRKPSDLVLSFASLAKTVDSPQIEPIILDDPEDNKVLACALAAEAQAIVSGDRHLKVLKEYRGIPILTATQFISQISE